MEVLSVKNLSFQYDTEPVLKDVTFQADRGELILFCGSCGCGKTTLLRLLKEEIRPVGRMTGTVESCYESMRTGYLFQNPESQIVCRTVEEELAFGAENVGMPRAQIARSIAELAAYLGMEELLGMETTKLSGGQKQMLNVASLLIMKPKLLLLDEPLSQLDPVSICGFVQLLRKIREELNITILVAEHHLEAFLQEADRVCYLENGCVEFMGRPQEFLGMLSKRECHFRESLPPTVKLYQEAVPDWKETDCFPLNVRQLMHRLSEAGQIPEEAAGQTKGQIREKADIADAVEYPAVLQVKSGYFRYEKNTGDILRNISLSLKKGSIYALIGGNGVGKSTLFSVLSGYRRLYRGKCICKEQVAVLPQNPVYAFFKDILSEDLQMAAEADRISEVLDAYEFCREVRGWMNRNPLDLSGGQMQKAAIVKMLLGDGNILLMDEPVKSMDGYEKKLFAEVLRELKHKGKTIVFISHDLEFVEEVADECLMMFDGSIIAQAPPEQMFEHNRFYTTVRGRLRGLQRDE